MARFPSHILISLWRTQKRFFHFESFTTLFFILVRTSHPRFSTSSSPTDICSFRISFLSRSSFCPCTFIVALATFLSDPRDAFIVSNLRDAKSNSRCTFSTSTFSPSICVRAASTFGSTTSSCVFSSSSSSLSLPPSGRSSVDTLRLTAGEPLPSALFTDTAEALRVAGDPRTSNFALDTDTEDAFLSPDAVDSVDGLRMLLFDASASNPSSTRNMNMFAPSTMSFSASVERFGRLRAATRKSIAAGGMPSISASCILTSPTLSSSRASNLYSSPFSSVRERSGRVITPPPQRVTESATVSFTLGPSPCSTRDLRHVSYCFFLSASSFRDEGLRARSTVNLMYSALARSRPVSA
eukprot:Opistho-2@91923